MVFYTYEEERQALLNEKAKLEKEIFRIRETESLKRAQRPMFFCLKEVYRRMPIRFLKTVFHTRRDILLRYASFTFDPFIVKALYEHMQENNLQEVTEYMVLYCEELKQCDGGYQLTLLDPHNKINVVVEKIPDKYHERNILHHMLQVKVVVGRDFFSSGTIRAEYIEPLPYTLECDGTDGEPRPIETVDYNTLKPLGQSNGKSNRAACMNMAQQLVENGAHRALPIEQEEELKRGFLYIRGMYKKYFLFFEGREVEAMVYNCGGLTEYELQNWKLPQCEYQRLYDITYQRVFATMDKN